MKLDMTRLPVGGMIIGFLLGVLIVTFVAAFAAKEDKEGGEAVLGSPTPAASPAPQASPTGGGAATVAVAMGDNFFDPKDLTATAGGSVTFQLTNSGIAIHNMRVAGPDGQYNSGDDAVSDPALVMGGGTATLVWQAPNQPGQIVFRCDFHAPAMAGAITVQ